MRAESAIKQSNLKKWRENANPKKEPMVTISTTEIRAICANCADTRKALDEEGASYLNRYQFTDRIYQPTLGSRFDYDQQFVRVRHYQETHWDQRIVVIAHKVRMGNYPLRFDKIEFDLIEDAESFLGDRYVLDLTFSRSGLEY